MIIWLNDTEPFPDYLAECLRTQQSVPGWSHKLLTLDDVPKDNTYLAKAIKERKWAKAADYFRVWYINKHGGVYLDADIEIRDDNFFDHILKTHLSHDQTTTLVAQLLNDGWIQNAFIMAYP
ncbi:MAG: glycosyltransferase, partial [Candidatus Omnitrophota bacterium]